MRAIEKSRGFSTLQVVAALAIAGTLTAAAANVLLPMYQRSVLNNAYEELYLVTNSVRQMREYTGDYSALTNFTILTSRGYIQSSRYGNGVNENVFGKTITTAKDSDDDKDAILTYTTATAAQCLNLVDRAKTINGVKATPAPACSTQILKLTIE